MNAEIKTQEHTTSETKIQTQKNELLAAAFCTVEGTGQIDDAWVKGGTERLSFEHPEHRLILGTVEIDSTVEDLKQVRLELVVPPELAVKVIQTLLSEPAEVRPERVLALVEAPAVVEIPPTREPNADDLAEMAAEEAEVSLPPEVVSVFSGLSG